MFSFQDMMNTMDECVQHHTMTQTFMDNEDEQTDDERTITICDTANTKLIRVMKVVEYLDKFYAKCKQLEGERSNSLRMLESEEDDTVSCETVPSAIKLVLTKNDEKISALRHEIAQLEQEIITKRDLPTVDVITEMRDALSKLRNDKLQQDNSMRSLEEDNKRLRTVIANLRNKSTNPLIPEKSSDIPTRSHAPFKENKRTIYESTHVITDRPPSELSFRSPSVSKHINLPPLQNSIKPMLPVKLSLDSGLTAQGIPRTPHQSYKYNPPQSARRTDKSSAQQHISGNKVMKAPRYNTQIQKYHEPKKLTYLKF